MPTMAQIILDAQQSGADPVAALQKYMEAEYELQTSQDWCAGLVRDVLAEQRQAGKPIQPENALDDYLDADFEDRVFGAGG